MARDLGGAVHHAHEGGIREEGNRPLPEGVGHPVPIAIEADVGLLARADRPDERGLEGMRGPLEQHALLLGEDLRDGLVALVRMAALMRDGVPPLDELRAQVVEIAERARGEEGMAEVLDLPLDFPFFIGPRGCAGAWREVIMPGELQQPRVKVHSAPLAIEDRRLEIVVHEGAGTPAHRVHGLDVPAQKTLERLVQREDGVHRARVAEHEHEGRERPRAAPDADRAEAPPIDLRDLPGQGG